MGCGGPSVCPRAYKEDYEEDYYEAEGFTVAEMRSALRCTAWLSKYVGVTEISGNNRIPIGEYNEYGAWIKNDDAKNSRCDGYTNYMMHFDKKAIYGVAFHSKCAKLIERELGYKVNFCHLWPLLLSEQDFGNCLKSNSYGGMSKYAGNMQEFQYSACVADGNEWMLHDPLKDKKNADRIIKVWTPLVKSFTKYDYVYTVSQPDVSST